MTTPDDNEPQLIDSRRSFEQAVLWFLRAADERGARTLCLVDDDFADWPLDDPRVIDRLTGWLRRPLRRLVLLAGSFDEMQRRHPRFCAWRPMWSHAIDARSPAEKVTEPLPCLALDDGPLSMQVHDKTHWRGVAARNARDARARRDLIDAVLQQSAAAWPVTPLGL